MVVNGIEGARQVGRGVAYLRSNWVIDSGGTRSCSSMISIPTRRSNRLARTLLPFGIC